MGNSPGYTTENIYGLLAAIATLLFRTCEIIVIRKCKSAHYAIMMFNLGWVAVIESLILSVTIGNLKWHQCYMQGLYIIFLGFFSYGAPAFLSIALQCEFAGPVLTMRDAVTMVLAFIWQIFLFHDNPHYFTIAGAALVGLSVIFISLMKWVSSLSEDSSLRKRLKWILI
ncbi:solute carrier family 35 member G1 [Caerostris darwini]|uniref:Solute carrier family 35 member G1 n=1 Tax=Caerostris darwini TaxID=1538125 RepID=A0AAV4W240_9ARAC|nr:solute carrier family 35 member G1 [Caerostris darwini]